MTAVGDTRVADRSSAWAMAQSASTLTLAAIVVPSSVAAREGPSDASVTVPIGVAVLLVLAIAGACTAYQLSSRRSRPCFRPGSLIAAQACGAFVVVSTQHLGYLGAVGALVGGAAGVAAFGVSWTWATDGEGVVAGSVSALAFVLSVWFVGRAGERILEGVVAGVGVGGCAVLLHRFRRRWRSTG